MKVIVSNYNSYPKPLIIQSNPMLFFRAVMSPTSMLMLPFSPTSLILGAGLLRACHSVVVYSPRDVHRRMAHTTALDLKFVAYNLIETVTEVTTLEKSSDMDYIIFPTLDTLPELDRDEFAEMCNQVFR